MIALIVIVPPLVLAYLQYLSNKEAKAGREEVKRGQEETHKAIADGTAKTDGVHSMLNSQLDAWKKQLEQKAESERKMWAKTLEDAVALVKAETVAESVAERVILEKRISQLETTQALKDVTQKAALDAALAAPAIVPTVVTTAAVDMARAAELAVAQAAPAALAAAHEAPAALSGLKPQTPESRLEEIRGGQKP